MTWIILNFFLSNTQKFALGNTILKAKKNYRNFIYLNKKLFLIKNEVSDLDFLYIFYSIDKNMR